MQPLPYTAVSLFSGAGGLDLGFKQTGEFDIIFANDLLSSAAETYSKNFGLKLEKCSERERTEATPRTILACDISKVSFRSLKDESIDVLVGGPPCQDFSIVRGPPQNGRGIYVKRGRLYAHFVRALAVLQPKIFVFENVPGLRTANGGKAYRVILDDFSSLGLRWPEVKKHADLENGIGGARGYSILISKIANFSALGVPQKRERLIIIGLREDIVKNSSELRKIARRAEILLSGRRLLFKKYPLTVMEVFEGRSLDELSEEYRDIMKEWAGVWEEVKTLQAQKWKQEVWERLTFDAVEDYLKANRISCLDRRELDQALNQHKEALRELGYYGRPLRALILPDGTTDQPKTSRCVADRLRMIPPDENHMFVAGTEWEVEGKSISFIYRRIHPLKPSYTITAYGGGGSYGYHYARSRAALTLREKARLQTFPDSFLFYGKKREVRAQIGEAVSPLVAKRIAEFTAEVLRTVS